MSQFLSDTNIYQRQLIALGQRGMAEGGIGDDFSLLLGRLPSDHIDPGESHRRFDRSVFGDPILLGARGTVENETL